VKPVYPTGQERDRFKDDCLAFKLAWKCDRCVHIVPTTGRCGLEYPNTELQQAESFETPRGTYVFCKHFELE